MPTTYKNRLRCSVSAVASSGLGAWTVSTAASRAVTFEAGDDGKTFTVLAVEGTDWEVRTGCVYTHSGTSLSRGTIENSGGAAGSGNAQTFTTACVLDATFSADAVRRWGAAALDHVAGTDANTTMQVNTLYVVDMSAWATANRTYTLPATAAVGDRVGILVSAGNTTYSLLITAASGDTLNGVAGGTEWSRLLIANEVVVARCVAANATWVIETDHRADTGFSATGDGTNTQNMSAGAGTTAVTGSSGALRTVQRNAAGYWDTTTGVFFPKRAGIYLIGGSGVIDAINDAAYMAVYLAHSTDGSSYSDAGEKAGIAWRGASSATTQTIGGSGSFVVSANGTTDRWLMRIYHNTSGTPKLPGAAANRSWARFWARWIGD